MFCNACGLENPSEHGYCTACGQTLDGAARPGPAAPTVQYAAFWRRVAALVLDFVLIYGVYLALSFGVAARRGWSPMNVLATMLSFYLPMFAMIWLYWAVLESSRWQATIGKKLLGIHVTDLKGNRLSFVRASGRQFAKGLSTMTFHLGFLMANFTARKQALHDLVAGTLVVAGPPR